MARTSMINRERKDESQIDPSHPLLGKHQFHHPFRRPYGDKYTSDAPPIFHPRTVVELAMYRISAAIREKPNWWSKIHDETIRKAWRREIGEQEEANNTPSYHRLTSTMLDYIFAELEDHAGMFVKEKRIDLGPYDRIWLADTLVSPDLGKRLILAVNPLEDVPDEEKDWHPGSGRQVLDLVHPSICPLVYDHTFGKKGNIYDVYETPPKAPDVEPECHSGLFQWLPSDFDVSPDGSVKLSSPYINNIHPIHRPELAEVIENVMSEAAVPLWEHVLTDLRWERRPSRLDKSNPDCLWSGERPYFSGEEEESWPITSESIMRRMRKVDSVNLPECPRYDGHLSKFYNSQKQVSLAGRTLQVIVKLANIILTPERPNYPGGKWHVEGKSNEHIVSTFIYYYDSDNVEDAQLNFRQATSEPNYHGQDDSECMQVLYDMQRDDPCVQHVGRLLTKKGRCIAFPNLYQHQVSPFKLLDKTKPGYRKILVLFLVDPTWTIPSATDIPPRQLEIHQYHLRNHGENSRLSQLPVELLDYIATLTPGVLDRTKAEEIRQQLMDERTVFIAEVDRGFFGQEFNMCEH